MAELDPKTARVCVVGAGPAGMAAARALSKNGYRHVTVLDAGAATGGKCLSVPFAGRSYEVGATMLADGYERVRALVEEVGLELVEMFYCGLEAGATQEYPFFPAEIVDWYRAFLDKAPNVLNGPLTFENVVKEGLHIPFYTWAEAQGLTPIPKLVLYFYQSCGYGYVGDPVPAVYFARGVCNGLGRAWIVNRGTQEIWRRLGAQLAASGVQLRPSTVVRRVHRDGPLRIETQGNETLVADALIWAAGAGPALSAVELLPEQRRAFEALRYVDYRVLGIEAEGLTERAHRLIMIEPHQVGASRGHVPFFMRSDPDRPLYTTWQVGSGEPLEQLEALAVADLTAIGAQSARVRYSRAWPHYFPHFSTESFLRGEPAALERAQGIDRLYFTGSNMAMETMESSVAHAEQLVARHFSS